MVNRGNKTKYVLVELAHHLPFSIFGVSLGIIIMGLLTFVVEGLGNERLFASASGDLFHVFHSSHVLFSAVATTAMFIKHEKRILKAVAVGFIGSIAICSLSDIYFPFIGGIITGNAMDMHICIIEEPGIILPFAVVGIIAGILVTHNSEYSTEYSHSAHVFISSAASLLYLMGHGVSDWVHQLGTVFCITILAVMIPCCASDIIFPLACVHRNCDHS